MLKTIPHRLIKSFAVLSTAVLLALTSGTSKAQDAGEIDMKMANLANQLSSRINGTPGWRVAVVPFANGGGLSSETVEYLVRSLSTQLINRSSIDVVERQLLSSAMNEMKLQQSGAFDRKSMAELGKLLGANAVITGSATTFQDGLSIHAVLIDVERGLNVGAGSVHLRREVRTNSNNDGPSAARQIHEPVLAGPRVQQFRTHRVELVRVQNFGDGRVGVWLRYIPTTSLSYTVLQGADGCTAQLTTNQGHSLRCVRSTLPPLRDMPNGMPLAGQPVIVQYMFQGTMNQIESNVRFQLNAVNSIAPTLLSSPVRNVDRVTVSFTDIAPI